MDHKPALLSESELIEVFNSTKTATAVHIGEEAIIQMANDAMLQIWGKDRSVIGKSLEEALPELVGQPFIDMFARVWRDGLTLSGSDTPADLEVDGEVKTYYFNFEYRAIKNAEGQTICVLHTAVDVTEQVVNREAIQKAYLQEQLLVREQAINEELASANEELNAINEELAQSQEELVSTNEQLEKRIQNRVRELYQSELKFRALSDELAAINEEMTAANEELMASNEELLVAQERLQLTFEQLEDREIALRLAIDAANFGTWHIHSVTRKFITSARLKELFGFYEYEDVTIEDALAQVTEEYRPYVAEKLESVLSGDGNYDVSYPVIGFHDQKLRWLRAMGNLKADKSGEFSSFTGVVMDISELKKDDERKNDFIGMVSHELKTPLTSLNGYVQILQLSAKKADNPFMISALDKANKQVRKMTSMINGFLNISRLESGKIVLNKSVFRIDELLENVIEEASLLDASHRISYAEPVQIEIFADQDKIANVISNLLSNAVKYSPENKDIQVRSVVVNGMVQVSVTDYGMGIQASDTEKLFERYYRVENNNIISGFGIGLYLSAEIIARHNGKIWVESQPNEGSTFYFTIPLNT